MAPDPFDPFGIEEHHRGVRERIAQGEPGLAQSVVSKNNIVVSYHAADFGTPIFHGRGLPGSMENDINAIVDEIILDVANRDGHCSPKTFLRSRIQFMIDDRRQWPSHWTKLHREAKILEDFYMNGDGRDLLR